MTKLSNGKISQCQHDLTQFGYTKTKIKLPKSLYLAVQNKDFALIDEMISREVKEDGLIFNLLRNYCALAEIEFIISLRESINDWEEDGIWHDDGSRILAFSLSLTLNKPKGGILEFRKKGETNSHKIETPEYGEIIIFKTGSDGYEHKINKVTEGSRLIVAGWCYSQKNQF